LQYRGGGRRRLGEMGSLPGREAVATGVFEAYFRIGTADALGFVAERPLQLLLPAGDPAMNATTRPMSDMFSASRPVSGEPSRFVVHVAGTPCEIRARSVATIADVLGYEAEMEIGLTGATDFAVDGPTVADLLDSRMIEPYRPRRRRQRGVPSRALFFATSRE
jgi:hypothetical protein